MLDLIYFLATPRGRFTRIVIGLLVVFIGTYVVGEPFRLWVQVLGLVPIVTGALNVCLFAPMIQEPVQGSKLI